MPAIGRMTNQLLSTEIARSVNRVTLELVTGEGLGSTTRLYTFLVNPEDINVSWPAKAQAVETLTDSYMEEWGGGLGMVTLSGITGYKARINPGATADNRVIDGYKAYQQLRDFLLNKDTGYLGIVTKNRNPANQTVKVNLRLHLWEDDEHYEVAMEGQEAFRKIRSSQRPLLYGFHITFRILGKVEPPALNAEQRGEIVAYQRARNAYQAIQESTDELRAWLAMNGSDPFLANAYRLALNTYNAAVSFSAQLAGTLNLREQTTAFGYIDLPGFAANLATTAGELVFSTLAESVANLTSEASEAVMGVMRPVRRIQCASQNLAGLQGYGERVKNVAAEVAEAYRDVSGNLAC